MSILSPIHSWFAQQSWKPITFQAETWKNYLAGNSGIIQVPTGSGKTYGAVMGPIAQMVDNSSASGASAGLQLLYITPLRALSRDIEISIRRPIEEMGWPITVESRTGDTKASIKSRQIKKMPNILITTPESLAVLLSYQHSAKRFGSLRCVILDEWHELMSSKRGTQTELCLSRLRQLNPTVQTWAISATLGNLQEAAEAATGVGSNPVIIRSKLKRETVIKSVLPTSVDSFPWAGHLGLRMFEELVEALDINRSTLIFVNTRSQAERWFQALTYALPDYEHQIALHHGSIDFDTRLAIEAGIKSGAIKWVVCTSSLDLGVDFQPVERVVQIGSAKNLARLLQRAGRSAHLPGGTSEVFFLPTNALELLEISAFRRGLDAGQIESRHPLNKPYDVLIQHLVTLACGDGFSPQKTLESIQKTVSYQPLSAAEFDWIVNFIEHGGKCLQAYPRYKKIVLEAGVYKIADGRIARMHKMSIGTITGNQQVKIAYARGGPIGRVEENFVSRLKKGDVFFFAGRQLEYFQMKDMTLYVKNAKKKSSVVPVWSGGYLAISDQLSRYIREEITQAKAGNVSAEVECIMPILATQDRISHLPEINQFLVECCRTREGQHLYVYPFEGRNVHEGLGFLWAYRFSQMQRATFTVSVNDYGFEILAPKDYPFEALFSADFFSTRDLYEEIKESLNISELTQRRFRGISQVAGLVFKGYPGSKKTANQVQISSSLIYEVFSKYEPDNLLLIQAEREVIEEQMEAPRLAAALKRMQALELRWMSVQRPSPFGFPLLVERLSSRLTNESLRDRITRLKAQWDR
ncbi:ligase-associated DNA damage response DEXH box helicase [cf. Phormidesmis sp. LEGE 11477]|uniref:ligase-associated DNA damage response DEXH box helicase n=1 Tax=cf. Phormidesmis sp. LEGE 11477 TaxID=1828680 RepID=UPI00187FFE9C|nr:ligase-associated DNA damage response DEXH box helicase [cf. Phormidesmis sp. LEGE 11477]MBE9062042.1 ligase-associated DNA damage response DEXH box helicase [cf. Phormidesmis sp. LEGE 11477]